MTDFDIAKISAIQRDTSDGDKRHKCVVMGGSGGRGESDANMPGFADEVGRGNRVAI